MGSGCAHVDGGFIAQGVFQMATMPGNADVQEKNRGNQRSGGEKKKPAKLSRLYKPQNMSLEDWQVELRRQFGRDQNFKIKNLGDHSVFTEFQVINPQSQNSYRVSIRGPGLGDNFCSCPDFATNALGTCKHVEFALAYLERKRSSKTALQAGFQPAY